MAEPLIPSIQEEDDARIRRLIQKQLMRQRESDPATAETAMGRGFDAAPMELLDRPPAPAAPPSNLDDSAVSSALAQRLTQEDRDRSSALAQPSPDHGALATARTQAPNGEEQAPSGFTPYHTPESAAKVELDHRLDTILRRAAPGEARTLINVLKMAQSDDEMARILDDYEQGTMVR